MDYFPILRERANNLGGSLSGGEQQMLAISRGLMAQPILLMMDEPSLGLSPRLTEVIFEAIKTVRDDLKFSVLLVEQRAVEALELCDRGYILECGRVTMHGNQDELVGNPQVQKAYLGGFSARRKDPGRRYRKRSPAPPFKRRELSTSLWEK